MPTWTFYCLDGKSERDNLWHDWWSKDAGSVAKASHETRLKHLETRKFQDWPVPQWYKPLKNGKGLGEIRLKGEVQWRILGFVRGDYEFVIVSICYHKDNRYYPNQEAIKLARDKMEIAKSQPSRVKKSVRPSQAS